MSRKLDIVNDAYSQLRISGLTVQPSPSNLQLALYRMEQFMAEMFEQRGLNVDYNFQESPALSQETGVKTGFFQFIAMNVALRLCPDFGKEQPPSLFNAASSALSGAIGVSAMKNARQLQPSFRMPLGEGNTFRWMYWNRYAQPVPNAPGASSTNYIVQGETFAYQEDFSAWLKGADIVSYEILVDPLLTLNSSSNDSPVISYEISAGNPPASGSGPWQIVLISVTDSRGLTDIRLVNYEVGRLPQVGA